MSVQAGAANLIEQMLADMSQSIIVTEGRGNTLNAKWAHVTNVPRGTIVGRHILEHTGQRGSPEPEEIYISASAAEAWCGKKNVSAKDTFNLAKKSGRVYGIKKFPLGSGTENFRTLGAPVECWHIKPIADPAVQQPAANAPATITHIAQRTRKKP
jgi:hypothetical protein